MKRIVSLILALSMVLSMFSMSFAGLKDVEGTKYEAAVEALIELGVVNGYPDGTFLPDNVVTRAELAKLLVVAYGLEPAAEASKGATAFSDIGAEHWASGYVNVSADYKFVNGYPEGTFKGDATVTYAEAITMCLRVLGYANEIDSKGTWPTNYIAKAQDLKLMKGIDFSSYNDGAKRGDIALLIWNMLRTRMWMVTGESEGDGLVSAPSQIMLNVKFADYKYSEEATFSGYTITPDVSEEKAVVNVTISGDSVVAGTYEYDRNDFFTFVPGTEVEVLVNEEDDKLLTMVPTTDNKLVDGTKEDLDDKEYTNVPSGDYVYARLLRKDVVDSSVINVSSVYVEEVEEKKDGMKVNKTTLDFDVYEDRIVLKDGERVTIKEIEAGDVFSTVTNGNETFYVIGYLEAEGALTKYVTEDGKNDITVDGEVYVLDANAQYVEDPEDEDENAKSFAAASAKFSDMKNEEVRIVLDAVVGKVVRIEFDGHIGDEAKDTTIKFFAITSEVERESSRVYTLGLEDENGADEYTFAEASEGMKYYNTLINLTGRFAAVKLNDEGEIVSLTVIADADGPSGDVSGDKFEYDEENHYNYVLLYSQATYDEDQNALMNGTTKIFDVDADTVIVTLLKDDKDTQDSADDEYSVTFETGLEAIEDLKGENVIVIYDEEEKFDAAKYVVLFDEISDKSDVKAGKLVSYVQNRLGDYEAEVETEDGTDESITKTNLGLADKKVVVYTTEVNSDDEVIMTVKATLDAMELTSGESGDRLHGYVEDASDDGKKADIILPGASEATRYEINTTTLESYEDLVVVLVEVVESSAADKADGEGDYKVDTVTVIADHNDIAYEKADRISGDPTTDEVIFIIRGMEER